MWNSVHHMSYQQWCNTNPQHQESLFSFIKELLFQVAEDQSLASFRVVGLITQLMGQLCLPFDAMQSDEPVTSLTAMIYNQDAGTNLAIDNTGHIVCLFTSYSSHY